MKHRLCSKTTVRLFLAIPTIIVLMTAFGCAGTRSASPQPSPTTEEAAKAAAEAAAAEAKAGGAYEIGPEDLLEISVWREKDLQREVLVRPDGWITFPLVGPLLAAGKTTQQLQAELSERLQKYIPDPVVTVTVQKIQGLKVFVLGRVEKPGEYMVGRYVDVLQALSLAGGLTPFANEDEIKILRRENGQERVIPFNYSEVARGRKLEQNIRLRAGDIVMVP